MGVQVVQAPSRNISINGLLNTIGGGLINAMLQREMAAKQYKYDDRLAASAAERAAQATAAANARQDDLISRGDAFYRENPNGVPGAGGLMGTMLALGAKGDWGQMQPYVLSTPQMTNLGDRTVMQQIQPNGSYTGKTVWQNGIAPADAEKLALAKQQQDYEQQLGQQQLALEKAKTGAQIAAMNRSGRSERRAQLLPDGKGGMVWVDPYSRTVTPAAGITTGAADAGSGGSTLEALLKASNAYKNLYGGNGKSGGMSVLDDGSQQASQQMDPITFLKTVGVLSGQGAAPGGGNPSAEEAYLMAQTGKDLATVRNYLKSKKK